MKAALYLRQSLDRAEGIEAQRKRCSSLATAKGWEIVAAFEDNQVRASDARGEGTGWHAMLSRVGTDFDIVIAVDLDRLVRSTKDLNMLIDLGAVVVTVDGEIDLSTADGEFRGTMVAAIARFETRRASERQKRHKAAKAERGEWHGGTPPYGYRLEGKSLVPDEDEKERIHEAARRLLDDREAMHSIVMDWNRRGVTTRKGNHWRQPNLRTIMLNRSMLGETTAGVVGWEPIIDRRTFDRLNALLTDPARKVTHSPGVKGGRYAMGGGLTVCGACGKPLITSGKPRPSELKPRQVALSCIRRVHGKHPGHPPVIRERVVHFDADGRRVRSKDQAVRTERITQEEDTGRVTIDHDTLELYVWDQLISRLNATPRWHKRLGETDPHINEQIDALEAERSALRDERKRAERAYIAGIMSERDARAEVARIDRTIDDLQTRLDQLMGSNAPILAEALSALRDTGTLDWKSWAPGRRRAALSGFIDRIEVGEFPQGFARNGFRKKGETEEEYRARQRESALSAVAARTNIVWRTRL